MVFLTFKSGGHLGVKLEVQAYARLMRYTIQYTKNSSRLERRKKRRFHIDGQVCCVEAHPLYCWGHSGFKIGKSHPAVKN